MPMTEDFGTVVPEAELRRRRAERGTVAEPAPTETHGQDDELVLQFLEPSFPSGYQKIDLSAWRERLPLGLAVKDYLLTRYAGEAPLTRSGQAELLDVFRDFLEEGWPEVKDLESLCKYAVSFYDGWLDERKSRRPKDDAPTGTWANTTKALRYRAFVRFIDFCWVTPRFRAQMPPALHFDRNPWRGTHLETKSHEPLTDAQRQAVVDACIGEIEDVIARLKLGEEIASDPTIVVPPVGTKRAKPFLDERVRLRAVIDRHQENGPSPDRVKELDPGLAKALRGEYGLREKLGSHLHFTSRSIVPFVLLLAMDSAFNPTTMLEVTLAGVSKEHPVDGAKRWVMSGVKRRARSRPSRSFSATSKEIDSSVQILKALIHHGAAARSKVPSPDDDKLLVYWQHRGEAFASFASKRGYKNWDRALQAFRNDNGLCDFTLVNLRATAAEIVDELSQGDVKVVQGILDHKHLSTTVGHYRSKAAEKRGAERLATRIDFRERFASTDGRFDFRVAEGPHDAVTSGFRCIDHKASPIPGQRPGRACDAYGACPTCRFAFVDREDAFARRRLTQLAERIEQAMDSVHARRLVDVWMPRLAALKDHWFPLFADDVAREASVLHVRPIPRIE